ncbi:MAG: lysine--tRNA ligase [Planctomycetota bacterium]|jgi:lysyl-tRNA synthetase class 2
MTAIEPEEFRLRKLEELRRLGIGPYGGRYPDTSPLRELVEGFEEREGTTVRVAGRIANLRAMGKASFIDIKDPSGRIQLFFQSDRLGPERFHVHQQLEPGDIVGVQGELTKTRTGEITIFVDEFAVLAKALLSPPEKWHGLRDREKRCRQRYVDLFTNDDVMACFLKRTEIVRAIREFLQGRGYVEVETPMMQPVPGGAAARPFRTHLDALDMDLYLRIAPELYLKRLLVGGMGKVFEINRNFRNEGVSTQHNPEFTMLELYEAYGDYETMMELVEELVVHLARDLCGGLVLPYGDGEVDLTPPWQRRKFWELLEEHAGLRRGDEAAIRARAGALGTEGAWTEHPDYLAYRVFEKTLEDVLINPTFVVDYPRSISPLARAKADDPELAERFELYVAGMELAPAYTELNDPQEQERRFLEQVTHEDERERLDKDFLRALSYGMPPAGGMGLGIDRLVMVLTNRTSIREVILFPLLRPEEGD